MGNECEDVNQEYLTGEFWIFLKIQGPKIKVLTIITIFET